MNNVIYFEDIVSIALLYIYGQSNAIVLPYNKAVDYFQTVKSNLASRGVIADYQTTNNKSEYYFVGNDELGNSYCIINAKSDLSKLLSTGRISGDIMIASQENNALEILGLEFKDGRIVRKDYSLKREL
ncbi:MAG: hypothetical protein E7158_01475 [Firmicutes bacterium]|nr:hypothetical protein [Bacillota bacterium]